MPPQSQGTGLAKAEGSRSTCFLESKENAEVGSGPKDSCNYQKNKHKADKLNTDWRCGSVAEHLFSVKP